MLARLREKLPAIDTTSRPAPGERGIAVALFFAVLALYLLTYVGAPKTNDERAMFSGTDSFIKRGEFTTNPIYWDYTDVGRLTTEGEMVPNYEPAQMVLAIPFYLWGRALDAPLQGVMFFGAVVAAATVALVYLCLLELGFGRRASALSALVYGIATIAWAYSKTFFRDPLALLMYLVAIYALLRYRPPAPRGWKWPALAGLALGVAIVTKDVAVAIIPSLLLLAFAYEWQRPGTRGARLKALTAALVPLMAILLLGELYDARTLAGIETFKRDIVDFTTNPQVSTSDPARILRGSLGLTISPFRGLFWYSPVLLLAFVGAVHFLRRHPWEGVAFGMIIATHLLGYSRYNFWAGGASWGPRYMLSITPFLVMLAAPVFAWLVGEGRATARRWTPGAIAGAAAIVLLIGVSVGIEIIGVSMNVTTYELRYLFEQAEIYGGIGEAIDATYLTPRFSPVFGQLRLLLSGTQPPDVAWMQWREQGTWAFVPSGFILSLVYLGLALVALLAIWRRPRLSAPLGLMLSLATVGVASMLLTIYRQGDLRFDAYNSDRFLRPMLETLEAVPCHEAAPGEPLRCDAVMVVPDPSLTDYFLNYLEGRLPWYATDIHAGDSTLVPAGADITLLDQLIQRYPTIYLVRHQSAQNDENEDRRAVERYLTEHAYKVGEQRFEEWSRLIRYSGASTPAEQSSREHSLGEIGLSEYELRVQNEASVPPGADPVSNEPTEPLDDGMVQARTGDTLQISLRWQAESVPRANYTVFVQLLDATPQVVLQPPDHQPGDGLFPTSTWTAGQVVTDNLAIKLSVPPGRYQLITGMYRNDLEGLPRLAGPEGDFIRLSEIVIHEEN